MKLKLEKLKKTFKDFHSTIDNLFYNYFFTRLFYYSVDKFIIHDETASRFVLGRKLDIDSNSLIMATFLTDTGKLQDLIRKIHFRCLFKT